MKKPKDEKIIRIRQRRKDFGSTTGFFGAHEKREKVSPLSLPTPLKRSLLRKSRGGTFSASCIPSSTATETKWPSTLLLLLILRVVVAIAVAL